MASFRVSMGATAIFIAMNVILIMCVSSNQASCPEDGFKFGACGSWLGLVTEVVGTKPSKECCALLKGVADLEAALCLCTAIKANVLGVVHLDVPVALTLLLNACGNKVPEGFVCA